MNRADESLSQLPEAPPTVDMRGRKAPDHKLDILNAKVKLYQATTILACTAAILLFLGV